MFFVGKLNMELVLPFQLVKGTLMLILIHQCKSVFDHDSSANAEGE